MLRLGLYLLFDGTCAEAMEFYGELVLRRAHGQVRRALDAQRKRQVTEKRAAQEVVTR